MTWIAYNAPWLLPGIFAFGGLLFVIGVYLQDSDPLEPLFQIKCECKCCECKKKYDKR